MPVILIGKGKESTMSKDNAQALILDTTFFKLVAAKIEEIKSSKGRNTPVKKQFENLSRMISNLNEMSPEDFRNIFTAFQQSYPLAHIEVKDQVEALLKGYSPNNSPASEVVDISIDEIEEKKEELSIPEVFQYGNNMVTFINNQLRVLAAKEQDAKKKKQYEELMRDIENIDTRPDNIERKKDIGVERFYEKILGFLNAKQYAPGFKFVKQDMINIYNEIKPIIDNQLAENAEKIKKTVLTEDALEQDLIAVSPEFKSWIDKREGIANMAPKSMNDLAFFTNPSFLNGIIERIKQEGHAAENQNIITDAVKKEFYQSYVITLQNLLAWKEKNMSAPEKKKVESIFDAANSLDGNANPAEKIKILESHIKNIDNELSKQEKIAEEKFNTQPRKPQAAAVDLFAKIQKQAVKLKPTGVNLEELGKPKLSRESTEDGKQIDNTVEMETIYSVLLAIEDNSFTKEDMVNLVAVNKMLQANNIAPITKQDDVYVYQQATIDFLNSKVSRGSHIVKSGYSIEETLGAIKALQDEFADEDDVTFLVGEFGITEQQYIIITELLDANNQNIMIREGNLGTITDKARIFLENYSKEKTHDNDMVTLEELMGLSASGDEDSEQIKIEMESPPELDDHSTIFNAINKLLEQFKNEDEMVFIVDDTFDMALTEDEFEIISKFLIEQKLFSADNFYRREDAGVISVNAKKYLQEVMADPGKINEVVVLLDPVVDNNERINEMGRKIYGLFSAVKSGNMEEALKVYNDINADYEIYTTALQSAPDGFYLLNFAVLSGNVDMLNWVIDLYAYYHADWISHLLSLSPLSNENLFQMALDTQNVEIIERVTQLYLALEPTTGTELKNALEHKTYDGRNTLMQIALYGNIAVLEKLINMLSENKEVMENLLQDRTAGFSALTYAAFYGTTETFEAMYALYNEHGLGDALYEINEENNANILDVALQSSNFAMLDIAMRVMFKHNKDKFKTYLDWIAKNDKKNWNVLCDYAKNNPSEHAEYILQNDNDADFDSLYNSIEEVKEREPKNSTVFDFPEPVIEFQGEQPVSELFDEIDKKLQSETVEDISLEDLAKQLNMDLPKPAVDKVLPAAQRALAGGYGNNCGLHCIIHSWLDLSDDKIKVLFNERPEIYNSILNTFYNDYGMQDKPHVDTFLKYIRSLALTDREVVLGPVFRKVLHDKFVNEGKQSAAKETEKNNELYDDALGELTRAMGADLRIHPENIAAQGDVPSQVFFPAENASWKVEIFHKIAHFDFTYGLDSEKNKTHNANRQNIKGTISVLPNAEARKKMVAQQYRAMLEQKPAAVISQAPIGSIDDDDIVSIAFEPKYVAKKEVSHEIASDAPQLLLNIQPTKPVVKPTLPEEIPISKPKGKTPHFDKERGKDQLANTQVIDSQFEKELKEKVFLEKDWDYSKSEDKLTISSKNDTRKLAIEKAGQGMAFSANPQAQVEIAKAANAYERVCAQNKQAVTFEISAKNPEEAKAFLRNLSEGGFDISKITAIRCDDKNRQDKELEQFTKTLIHGVKAPVLLPPSLK